MATLSATTPAWLGGLAMKARRRVVCSLVALLLVGLGGLLVSRLASRDLFNTGATLFAYIALAEAWNILGGLSGQMSLGVGAFVGTGAYTMALTMDHLGWSWPVGLVAAMVAAGLLSALLAFPLLRLHGDYFAVGTLAAALAIEAFVNNWSFAGGSSGISLPIQSMPSLEGLYLIGLVVALVALACAVVLRWSRFGLRLLSLREDELGASLLGVDVFSYRLFALVTCGLLTGLAGGLFAMIQINFVPSDMFGMTWTIESLLMVIVGGMGTVIGPVVGAIAIYYGVSTELATYPTLSLFLEGGLLLAIVRFIPEGLWPFVVTRGLKLIERWHGARGLAVLPRRAQAGPSDSRAQR
jgi:branched-chain amino acid transport system permease protein